MLTPYTNFFGLFSCYLVKSRKHIRNQKVLNKDVSFKCEELL